MWPAITWLVVTLLLLPWGHIWALGKRLALYR